MIKSLLMVTVLTVIGTIAPAYAGTSFIDLTPQEYKGPDADLSGISLTKFGVNCEENGGYVAGDPAYVSWENQSGRSALGKGTWGVQRYIIHFRVKDRKGKIIHEEDFRYFRGNSGTFPNIQGQVVWGAMYPNRCARNMVRFSKQVDLSFATVEYWLTKIAWMKEKGRVTNFQEQPDSFSFAVPVSPHKNKSPDPN